MSVTIHRISSVQKSTGLSRSSIYDHVKQGLLPKPISLGARAVGWLDYEIAEIIDARISGASEKLIKQLVQGFHIARPYRSLLQGPNHKGAAK